MVLKRFAMKKLVRDKTVERQYNKGATSVVARTLEPKEYRAALQEKLVEEIQEIFDAHTVEELVSECADVLEVIEALLVYSGKTFDDVRKAQKEKNERRGGFVTRCFIESVVAPEHSEIARYCSQYPGKYPELLVDKV